MHTHTHTSTSRSAQCSSTHAIQLCATPKIKTGAKLNPQSWHWAVCATVSLPWRHSASLDSHLQESMSTSRWSNICTTQSVKSIADVYFLHQIDLDITGILNSTFDFCIYKRCSKWWPLASRHLCTGSYCLENVNTQCYIHEGNAIC